MEKGADGPGQGNEQGIGRMMPRIATMILTGCRCPQCRYDAWMEATIRHNAGIAMAHAVALRDPIGIRRVENFLLTTRRPTGPLTCP